jgi:WD40 repeat protein
MFEPMSKIYLYIACVFYSAVTFAQGGVNKPNKILPGHINDILVVAVPSNGEFIASGGWEKNINIYTNDSLNRLIKSIPDAHLYPLSALTFSRDGKMLASGSADNTIRVWDSVFNPIKTLEGHTGKITALLIDPTRRFLISGAEDRQIILWDIKSGKQIKKLDNGSIIHSFALGTDGKSLYVACAETGIKVYTIGVWTIARTFTGHTDIVNSIAISPDGKLLLSGSNDKSARLWDIASGKETKKLPVDCWKVQAVSFTRDGKYFATGCNDGIVRIWQTDGAKLIGSISAEGENVKGLAFNKNNETIAVGNMLRGKEDFGLRIWPTFIPKPVVPGAAPKDSTQLKGNLPMRKDTVPVQPGKNQPPVKPAVNTKPSGK